MLEHFVLPLGPYLLTTAFFLLWTLIFLSLKKEICRLRQRLHRHSESLELAHQELLQQIEEMRGGLRDVEERSEQLVPPQPTKSGLNLNKRGQVIRMYRRGDGPDHIATLLDLPKNEVDLLIKVYKLAMSGPAPNGTIGFPPNQ